MTNLSVNNVNNTRSNKPYFYGWIIVASCMLIQAIPAGIVMNAQPQFINFVLAGEGFTLTQFSLLFTIGTIVSATVSPYIGKILSNPKSNLKLIYVIGSILAGGGFALYSLAGSRLWAYYGISALVQVGTAIISSIGVPLLVNSWFKENKGLAMGIAFSGGGIGNIFLQQITARLLSDPNFGYAKAYFIFGIASMAVSLPISLFLVKLPKDESELRMSNNTKGENPNPQPKSKDSSPEVNNEKVPIVDNKEVSNKEVNVKKVSGYTLNEVLKIKYFWILCIGFIFIGCFVSGLSVQYASYLYSLKLSATFVGNVGSIFAFFSIFGNLCGGLFFDKLGIKNSLLVACFMVIGCSICLIYVPQYHYLGYLFAIFLGVSIFTYIIGPSYLTGSLFGDREFGAILGVIQLFFAIGYAFGTVLFGMSIEKFGYSTSWAITIVYTVIAYSFLLISCIKIQKMNKTIQNIIK